MEAGHIHRERLAKHSEMINYCQISVGTYVGDGVGSNDWSSYRILGTFDFEPKYVRIIGYGNDGSPTYVYEITDANICNEEWHSGSVGTHRRNDYRIRISGNEVHISDEGVNTHPNVNGTNYYYMVLG